MTRHNALFERLLRQRGVDEGFLNPDYGKLADVSLMPDLSRAVDRIMLAAKEKERVVVYGDYDVDGVCSSTVMKEALTMVGVDDVTILLPDRFGEGYGMNMGAVKEIENLEASLVVTVDCGSGSGEVIRALKQMGIDTIVTDHHEIGDVPGEAVAVLASQPREPPVAAATTRRGSDSLPSTACTPPSTYRACLPQVCE